MAEEVQLEAEAPPIAGETSGCNRLQRLLLTESEPAELRMVLLESEQVPAARRAGDSSEWGQLGSHFPLCGRARAVTRRGEDWRLPNRACCVAVPDGADQALPEVPVVGQRVHHPEEV